MINNLCVIQCANGEIGADRRCNPLYIRVPRFKVTLWTARAGDRANLVAGKQKSAAKSLAQETATA